MSVVIPSFVTTTGGVVDPALFEVVDVRGDGSFTVKYLGEKPFRIAGIVYPDGTKLPPSPYPIAPGCVVALPAQKDAPDAARLGKVKATGEVWRNGKLVTD